MNFRELLLDYKEHTNCTNDWIAEQVGVTKSTVGRWISGDIRKMHEETMEKLSELLGVNVEPIVNGNTFQLQRPILGTTKAGYDMFIQENYLGNEEVTEHDFFLGDYFVKVEGDSMIGNGIMDGDLAFIKQCSQVNSGDIALIMIDDTVTIKKVVYKPDVIILEASNPLVENRYFTYKEARSIPIRILGKVIYSKTYL